MKSITRNQSLMKVRKTHDQNIILKKNLINILLSIENTNDYVQK